MCNQGAARFQERRQSPPHPPAGPASLLPSPALASVHSRGPHDIRDLRSLCRFCGVLLLPTVSWALSSSLMLAFLDKARSTSSVTAGQGLRARDFIFLHEMHLVGHNEGHRGNKHLLFGLKEYEFVRPAWRDGWQPMPGSSTASVPAGPPPLMPPTENMEITQNCMSMDAK